MVVGYGPTGRTVVRLLRDNDITPTVIDLNIDAVRALREDGVDAVYGDAMRPETLEAAGVPSASHLILGSAGMANGDEVIRLARQLNPDVRVLARTDYVRDVPPLKQAGATAVYSGEGEVGARVRRRHPRRARRDAGADRPRTPPRARRTLHGRVVNANAPSPGRPINATPA